MTKMTELFARQGMAIDSDEYAEAKQMRREKNMAAAREVLDRNHIHYDQVSEGWFQINELGHRIQYQPYTGEWIDYDDKPVRKRYGIRNLVRHLRGKVD